MECGNYSTDCKKKFCTLTAAKDSHARQKCVFVCPRQSRPGDFSMSIDGREPPCADVIGLPLFHVDAAFSIHLGDGLMSVINYRNIRGVLVPQFEALIGARKLMDVTQSLNDKSHAVFVQETMSCEAVRH
jgi:hypothetical protein